MNARTALLIACFVWFLYPVSVDGNSVNYSFVLLPLGVILLTGKCRRPSDLYLAFVAYYVLVYLVASVYQYDLYSEAGRRAISFLLFMSLLSYLFIEIDADMVRAFKAAIVVISLWFSLWAIVSFFTKGVAALDPEVAKDTIGSQRFGFVYLLALTVLYVHPVRGILYRAAKILGCLVLLIGLALTFSRASIVSTVVSILAYLVWSLRHAFRRPAWALPRLIAVVGGVALAYLLVRQFLPIVPDFFEDRLISFLTDPAAVESTLSTSHTSEGERLFIWGHILDYLARNPLTGSGYVGVWSLKLFEGMSGSAHSQYADVLFRTGWLGFLIYLYLIYRIGKHLYRYQIGLFWGFLGVLVYGLFHETFKDSQGGFLLAFFIGMMSQAPAAVADRRRGAPDLVKAPPTDELGYGA